MELVPVQDVLHTDVDFKRTVALAWVLVISRDEFFWYRRIVPFVRFRIDFVTVRDWTTELNFCAVDVVAAKQVVITHPL